MFLLTLHYPAFPSSPPATMKVTGTTLRKRLGRLCSMPRTEESESFLRLISRKPSMWEFHSLCYVWVLCMCECVLFVWLCIALWNGLRHIQLHSTSHLSLMPHSGHSVLPSSLPIVTLWLIASACFCWNHKCFTWGVYLQKQPVVQYLPSVRHTDEPQ